MACEYVSELKDEAWRDAIEAFLGVHRYAILVSPQAFDVGQSGYGPLRTSLCGAGQYKASG